MRRLFSIFKHLIKIPLIILVILYVGIYTLLLIPSIQEKVKKAGVTELTALLHTPVQIDRINISPFNKLELFGVLIPDQQGDTLLYAKKLAAGIEISDLFYQHLVFNNIQLFGVDARISKAHPDSVPNFQFIIDTFKKDKPKQKNNIDLRINSALIRRGRIQYDILSESGKAPGLFDKNHIEVHNLLSTISLKAFTRDSINMFVKRLSFEEKSGFALKRMSFRFITNAQEATLNNLLIHLNKSQISSTAATINMSRMDSLQQFCDSAQIHFKLDNSKLVLQDASPFVPALSYFTSPVSFSVDLSGSINQMKIKQIKLQTSQGNVSVTGDMNLNYITDKKRTRLECKPIELNATAEGTRLLIENLNQKDASFIPVLSRLGNIHFNGDLSGYLSDLSACGILSSDCGSVHSDLTLRNDTARNTHICTGFVETKEFDLYNLFGQKNPYGKVSFSIQLDAKKTGKKAPEGSINGIINRVDYNDYPYENIEINGLFGDNRYEGFINIEDPNGKLRIEGLADINKIKPEFDLTIRGSKINLHKLHLTKQYPGYELSFATDANFTGNNLDNSNGTIKLDSVKFSNGKEDFKIAQFTIEAHNQTYPQSIAITSDYINGSITGKYRFSTLKQSAYKLLSSALPSLLPELPKQNEYDNENDFSYYFTFEPNIEMARIFNLPVTLTDRAILQGSLSDPSDRINLSFSAPYLWHKKKQLEDITVTLNKSNGKISLLAEVSMFNKKLNSHTNWNLRSSALQDNVDLIINWNNDMAKTYCGEINTSTHIFRPDKDKSLQAEVKINPSQIIFNDTIWQMHPADISIRDKQISVNNFEIAHESQHIRVNGAASPNPEDMIVLRLNDVNLDYVFETLNINNVTFGGRATGDFTASSLFSGAPQLNTDRLFVKNFSYNYAIFGDLNLHSMWNNDNKGILMQGHIDQAEGYKTRIDGYIFPTKDSLSLSFDAQKLNISFLQPFISKIMKNISGTASGHIDFYGNFKELTVAGDAYAENLKFGIEYLNTAYTLSDSVHLTPSSVSFNNVTVHDKFGHTAKAGGLLRHHYFKDLTFDISITDARNFLSYNVTELQSPTYYGTIFGTGSASIKGNPTRTDIDVNMSTAGDSKFTFVLSNTEAAGDYTFITFTDRRKQQHIQSSLEDSTVTTNNARMLQERQTENVLYLNLQVDAGNNTAVNLVMDPSSGDMIKATGNGAMRLEYNSSSEDINIYGTYTLEKGNYNFSLQDIIMRDFSIRQGSSIAFHGNPMAAMLDISAIYSLTANLLDLDETFVNDKDLTRTTVPVYTVLNVRGDIQHPDLSFDIEFPTLTQDIDRKVKSIINTDDMMNRQIIYLLALNRFYTPDYMNTGQNRNNELASVASSTLSSQLTNILGQLSDNWSIAPNFRSEKGDFSDMEVELALSSQLLNNRLIFNGNFGYRDNTMNNNTFIGDFDLEYLLTKSGNLRLKAYNHYNDRNYYIKSALTTQGVGILFKRDFNRVFGDLIPWGKKKNKLIPDLKLVTDSVQVNRLDSIPSTRRKDVKIKNTESK